MSIRYAPYIEGTIPAFGPTLKVPHEMNRGVADASVKAIVAKISDLNSNPETTKYVKWTRTDFKIPLGNEISFSTIGLELIAQNYYKIQIAYSDNASIGEEDYNKLVYSSVGIGLYFGTNNPYINSDYDSTKQYRYLQEFEYDDNGSNEIPYSYQIKIINSKNNEILYDSNKCYFNNNNTIYFLHFRDWGGDPNNAEDMVEQIILTFTTSNGYVGEWVVQDDPVDKPLYGTSFPNETFNLTLSNYKNKIDCYRNGAVYIDIDYAKTLGGRQYLLLRSTDQINWNIVENFILPSIATDSSSFLIIDNFVEPGQIYYYDCVWLRPINGNLNAKIIPTARRYDIEHQKDKETKETPPSILVDQEHSVLIGENKLLSIEYNPKISSFKTTLQETKTDTIGGQYPIFYRNGAIGYKEFPISGLISYHMDEAEQFIPKEELGLASETIRTSTENKEVAAALNLPTHNLVGYNIAAEKKFKMAVLDWLNDGKVKIFKSPTEGMYLIRLMNTSLSPDDKLGRMIHTFNSTAYEVGEVNYDNLVKYDLLKYSEPWPKQWGGIIHVVG